MTPMPGKREALVNLERVWFWSTLRRLGLQPQLEPAGAQVKLERLATRGVLY